jgi:hypothetical protein
VFPRTVKGSSVSKQAHHVNKELTVVQGWLE